MLNQKLLTKVWMVTYLKSVCVKIKYWAASPIFFILLILCSSVVFGKSLMKLHSVFRNVSLLSRNPQKTVGAAVTSSRAKLKE